MQAGDADMSIMGRPPRDLDARAEVFAPHPLLFVGAADHPLAEPDPDGRPHRAASLAAQALIAREAASGTRNAMDGFLAQHHVTPRIVMEMPSSETIKQAVIAGMGIAFLSLHTVGLELRHGLLKVLAIDHTPVMRGWHVVHLGSKVLSPAAEAFRYFVLEHGPAWLRAHDDGLVPSLVT